MVSKQDKGKIWDKVYTKKAHWEGGVSKAARNLSKRLKKGDKILDLGCGSGDDSIFLAKKGFPIWGIDISRLAIKKAKSLSKLKNLHLSLGDIDGLKFKNNFFDAVICMWVLNSKTTSLEKSSKEIHRVLKKEGIATIGNILNIKYQNKKIERFRSKKDIINAFKNFKILEKIEFETHDKHAKPQHKHDVLILSLKK